MPRFVILSASGNQDIPGTLFDSLEQSDKWVGVAPGKGSYKCLIEANLVRLVEVNSLEEFTTLVKEVGGLVIFSSNPYRESSYGRAEDTQWPEGFRQPDGTPFPDLAGSIVIYDGFVE